MSSPASACCFTTSATDWRNAASYAACFAGFSAAALALSNSAFGRIRLPTCVVKMRRSLRFKAPLPYFLRLCIQQFLISSRESRFLAEFRFASDDIGYKQREMIGRKFAMTDRSENGRSLFDRRQVLKSGAAAGAVAMLPGAAAFAEVTPRKVGTLKLA